MKRMTLVAVLAIAALGTKAQFFYTDVGGSIFIGKAKPSKGSETLTLEAAFYGLSWYPRYTISQNENSSFSVGVPLTFGISGSANSREGGDLSFGLDLPVVFDYNFGYNHALDEEGAGGTGGFIGAGFSFTTTSSSSADNYNTTLWNESDVSKATSYGPMVHAGIRFPIKQGEKTLTFRISYKKGLESVKYNFFGGTILVGL
jgi:hypothetical protein